ncbi:hypothetical protein Z043_117496, partial [Scleropages formosus]
RELSCPVGFRTDPEAVAVVAAATITSRRGTPHGNGTPTGPLEHRVVIWAPRGSRDLRATESAEDGTPVDGRVRFPEAVVPGSTPPPHPQQIQSSVSQQFLLLGSQWDVSICDEETCGRCVSSTQKTPTPPASALMPNDDSQPLTPSRMSQRQGKESLQVPGRDHLNSPSFSTGSNYSHVLARFVLLEGRRWQGGAGPRGNVTLCVLYLVSLRISTSFVSEWTSMHTASSWQWCEAHVVLRDVLPSTHSKTKLPVKDVGIILSASHTLTAAQSTREPGGGAGGNVLHPVAPMMKEEGILGRRLSAYGGTALVFPSRRDGRKLIRNASFGGYHELPPVLQGERLFQGRPVHLRCALTSHSDSPYSSGSHTHPVDWASCFSTLGGAASLPAVRSSLLLASSQTLGSFRLAEVPFARLGRG